MLLRQTRTKEQDKISSSCQRPAPGPGRSPGSEGGAGLSRRLLQNALSATDISLKWGMGQDSVHGIHEGENYHFASCWTRVHAPPQKAGRTRQAALPPPFAPCPFKTDCMNSYLFLFSLLPAQARNRKAFSSGVPCATSAKNNACTYMTLAYKMRKKHRTIKKT